MNYPANFIQVDRYHINLNAITLIQDDSKHEKIIVNLVDSRYFTLEKEKRREFLQAFETAKLELVKKD